MMETKFYQYASRLHNMKRHINELNSKLISYIELASENLS
jgi:hypothetical protein